MFAAGSIRRVLLGWLTSRRRFKTGTSTRTSSSSRWPKPRRSFHDGSFTGRWERRAPLGSSASGEASGQTIRTARERHCAGEFARATERLPYPPRGYVSGVGHGRASEAGCLPGRAPYSRRRGVGRTLGSSGPAVVANHSTSVGPGRVEMLFTCEAGGSGLRTGHSGQKSPKRRPDPGRLPRYSLDCPQSCSAGLGVEVGGPHRFLSVSACSALPTRARIAGGLYLSNP